MARYIHTRKVRILPDLPPDSPPSDSLPPIDAIKRDIRAKLRHRRDHFVANINPCHRQLMFGVAPSPLRAVLAEHRILGAYAAKGSEADILPLLTASMSEDQRIALPYFTARNAPMLFRLWRPGDELEIGPYKVAQPLASATPETPDLLLIPVLGFDRALNRLGQGGGHYDRYCAVHPDAVRIGIAWDVQEIDLVPTEATDIPLNAILTQNEWISGS